VKIKRPKGLLKGQLFVIFFRSVYRPTGKAKVEILQYAERNSMKTKSEKKTVFISSTQIDKFLKSDCDVNIKTFELPISVWIFTIDPMPEWAHRQ